MLYSHTHYLSNHSTGACMTPNGENINISQLVKANDELNMAQNEEILALKSKNLNQEQEIQKLRQ